MTSWLLPQVVAAYVAEQGPLHISVDSVNAPDDVELVASRQAELGFALPPLSSTRVVVQEMFTVPCVCILPPGHPLAAKPIVSLHDLAGEPFVSLETGTTTRLRIDAAFAAANIDRRVEIEARWAASVAGLVAAGLGLSIIDPFSAHTFALQGGIVRPLAHPVDFSFAAVQPRTDQQELALAFLEVFGDVMSKIPFISEPWTPPVRHLDLA